MPEPREGEASAEDAVYRKPILRELADAYPLWLLCAAPPEWVLPYLQGWTAAEISDRSDGGATG